MLHLLHLYIRRATCCNAEPKKSDKPIKKDKITNVLRSNLNSDLNFVTSNKNSKRNNC